MSNSIPIFLSYLLFIGSARALINATATNCTDDTFAWVGSVLSNAVFGSIIICLLRCPGILIGIQFASTKPLLGRSILGSGM